MADPITSLFGQAFSGGGGSGILPGILTFFKLIGFYGLVGVILAFVMVVYSRGSKYKIRATIFVKKADRNVQIITDRLREVEDSQGKPIYECLKTKRGRHKLTLPKVDNKYLYQDKRKDHVFLWLDDNKQVHPVKFGIGEVLRSAFSKDERERVKRLRERNASLMSGLLRPVDLRSPDPRLRAYLRPVPHDRLAWNVMERKRQQEKLKATDKFLQYAGVLVPIATMVLCFLILYFMWQNLGSGLSALASSFGELGKQCIG